jgi:threonine dehydrogenase-like Zn-dependent dehydrogenase
MSLVLTPRRRVRYQVGAQPFEDAIALSAAEAGSVRYFVPGFLPCGECQLCRRGLVGACPAATRPLAETPAHASLTVADRFVAPVDEPADAAPLSDEIAALAGLTAFALHAQAAASLAPGDFAIWIGQSPVAAAGASISESRGASAFHLRDLTSASATAEAELADRLAALAAAPATAHGARKRALFLTAASPAAWQTAARLADPGAIFVALGTNTLTVPALTLPAESRVVMVGKYHPDFLAEALASLRRKEVETDRFVVGPDGEIEVRV